MDNENSVYFDKFELDLSDETIIITPFHIKKNFTYKNKFLGEKLKSSSFFQQFFFFKLLPEISDFINSDHSIGKIT